MFGLSLYRNEKHKWRTLVIFGRHDWFRADGLLFTSVSALYLNVIFVFYTFRSHIFDWSELCRNAAFSLLPTSRQGNTDDERGKHCSVSPAPRLLLYHLWLTSSPPTILPLRAELTRGLDESRDLENCSGSEWKLCWLIRGGAQATPSLFEQLAPCCTVRKVTLRSKLILGLPFVSSWNLPALLFSLTLTYPITMHNGIWIFNEETHSSSYNSLMFHASRGGTDHCISCYISLKVLFLSDR